MQNLWLAILVGVFVDVLGVEAVRAGGISVDAGLTPAEDRWIFRTQARYMRRENDPTPMGREMEMYAFPTVLAYGVRRDVTLLVRQITHHQAMSMAGAVNRETGLGDLFLLGKYKVYRRNAPTYTLGVASTLGVELPTGKSTFTSETWDLQPGLFTSWRAGPWASDLNVAYKWNGFADRGVGGLNPGDELSIDLAVARQFSLGGRADTSFAPVLECSYKRILPDRLGGGSVPNTGESLLFISPGIKFTKSSFILEALLQVPVWQDQVGAQLEQAPRVIVGARIMF